MSCDASAAMKNFVDLCRPASKTAKGDPFFPVKVTANYPYERTDFLFILLIFPQFEICQIVGMQYGDISVV